MATDRSTTIDVPELEKMVQPEEKQWERRSIYKLPPCVTKTNKTAYTPQMVSFGPYHYEDEDLKQMEWQKQRALNQFIKRSNLTYGNCFQSLLEIVEELMAAYDWLDPKLDTNVFLDTMIRDGVFMLEIFGDKKKRASGYAVNDPIFSEHGNLYVIPHIKRDMLMIENQIPMKVLHKLFRLQFKDKDPNKWQEMDANEVVFQFFFPDKIASVKPPNNSLHLLDMYRTVMLGSYSRVKKVKTNTAGKSANTTENPEEDEKKTFRIGGEKIIRSAVELTEAGVEIKWSKTSRIHDIRFRNGVLWLPRIVVDDSTESLLLNLIAYERFHVGAGNDVTSFAFFMDNIIDDSRDIKLLYSNNIIQNGIGSDKAAAKMFNLLSRNISPDDDNRLAGIYASVNAYCKTKIPKYRAALCHTYFTNPWAVISFFAAIIFFLLTITDSTFSVMEFYKKE